MILVDSSVWVDYLRGVATPQADKLEALLGMVPLAIGDLILTEVLQRCATDRDSTLSNKPSPRSISSFWAVTMLKLKQRGTAPSFERWGSRCQRPSTR